MCLMSGERQGKMQGLSFLLNRKVHGIILVFSLMGLIGLMGCGPSPSRLYVDGNNSSVPIKFDFAQVEEGGKRCLYSWYRTFNVPGLKSVVEEALENNLDVKIAAERLLELKYAYLKSVSSLYPRIDLSAGVKRQRSAYELNLPFKGATTVTTTSNTYSLEGVVSYEWDIWGKLRYEREAGRFSLLEGGEAQEVVKLGVVSLAVEYYFELASLNKKISLMERKVAILKRLYLLADREFNRGIGSINLLKERKNALLQGEIYLNGLIKERKGLIQKFNLLLGRYPHAHTSFMPPISLSLKIQFPSVPLPSQVLERRPDIKEALYRVRSALARYGYARALRFPSITLSASGGFISGKLRSMFDPVSRIWAISSEILYPLFNKGRLKYNQKQREAVLKRAIISYQKTVLTAFLEVESALMTSRRLRKELENTEKILENLQVERKLEEMRYCRGLSGASSLFGARLRCIDGELRLIDVKMRILKNQIFLFKAIGGSFRYKGEKKR